MEGMLEPERREVMAGTAEVRETFKVPNRGLIAGCYVLSGTMKRNSKSRVIRNEMVLYEGTIDSLKRFKDDVREVQTGFECGIGFHGFDDITERRPDRGLRDRRGRAEARRSDGGVVLGRGGVAQWHRHA